MFSTMTPGSDHSVVLTRTGMCSLCWKILHGNGKIYIVSFTGYFAFLWQGLRGSAACLTDSRRPGLTISATFHSQERKSQTILNPPASGLVWSFASRYEASPNPTKPAIDSFNLLIASLRVNLCNIPEQHQSSISFKKDFLCFENLNLDHSRNQKFVLYHIRPRAQSSSCVFNTMRTLSCF